MQQVPTPSEQFDLTRVKPVVEAAVRAHGGELWGIEWKHEGRDWVLRLFVEKHGAAEQNLSIEDGALELESCVRINREISAAFDVDDPIPCHYSLEVSSPGLERTLRTFSDVERFRGSRMRVKFVEPVLGSHVVIGEVSPTGDGAGERFTLKEGSKVYESDWANVASARLVFEFGAGGMRSGKKTASR